MKASYPSLSLIDSGLRWIYASKPPFSSNGTFLLHIGKQCTLAQSTLPDPIIRDELCTCLIQVLKQNTQSNIAYENVHLYSYH